MSTDRIEWISEYCDRWCERCAFTQRCAVFATRVAIAMCGDVRHGLELAMGPPHRVHPEGEPPSASDWLADVAHSETSAGELAEFARRERDRRARIDASPLMYAVGAYAVVAARWCTTARERLAQDSHDVLRDAVAVLDWDAMFIGGKLRRALLGRDRCAHDEDVAEDDPVQTDWNGSAKVALISIERSEAAWLVVASSTSGELPALMADFLAQLRDEVDREFPDARRFVRPGFDEGQLV